MAAGEPEASLLVGPTAAAARAAALTEAEVEDTDEAGEADPS